MKESATTSASLEFENVEDKYILPRLICVPLAICGVHSLNYQNLGSHPLTIAMLTAATAYFMFCWTSCFHECAHQTLSSARWVSVWFGRLIGTVMLVPYTVYRESHIRHHAFLNKPTDWELWPYADPSASLTFRRCFVWLDLVLGSITAPIIYARIYFHPRSPIHDPAIRRAIRNELLCIGCFWGALIAYVTWYGHWPAFTRSWLIPWLIAGFLQTGRKLTEHLGMPSYDPLLGTRTVMGPNWLTRFGSYVNFDIFIHGLHHRHPRVAHTELRKKMWGYVVTNPTTHYPVYKTYGHATWSMLPFLWNPGCGVNAGAGTPHTSKRDDVQDFVVDASREILSEADVGRIGSDVIRC
jgi:fatty acid desaturase